ncbi:MAG: EamA family transporter [Patescibacteria group bacterium]
MNWFIVALGAPFVWSLVNHCDKIILQRYFKTSGGPGGLMVFVGVVAIPLSLILYIFDPSVLNIDTIDITFLIITGFLYNLAVLFSLYALESEDASSVVAYMQLIPVFTYFFGILFLSEYITTDKAFGGIIALFGAILLSTKFEKGFKKAIFNKRIILLMLGWAVMASLGNILFKKVSISDSSFVLSLFWNQIGMALFGIMAFCISSYRKSFLKVIKHNSTNVVLLNIFEQIVEVVGIILNYAAILLAPTALVILVEYTAQPLFVFIEGIIFTILFPKFVAEDISKGNLIQKFISMIIMGVGLYMITN